MTQTRQVSFLAGLLLVGTVAAIGYTAMGGDETARICRPGYARSERLPADQYYPIAQEAYRRAGIPWSERHSHRLDHVIPLCAGGTWAQDNLQIQTIEAAAAKDVREVEACKAVCAGTLTLDAARAQFRRDR